MTTARPCLFAMSRELRLSRVATSLVFPSCGARRAGGTAGGLHHRLLRPAKFCHDKRSDELYLYLGRRSRTGGAASIYNRTEEYSAMLWTLVAELGVTAVAYSLLTQPQPSSVQ